MLRARLQTRARVGSTRVHCLCIPWRTTTRGGPGCDPDSRCPSPPACGARSAPWRCLGGARTSTFINSRERAMTGREVVLFSFNAKLLLLGGSGGGGQRGDDGEQ